MNKMRSRRRAPKQATLIDTPRGRTDVANKKAVARKQAAFRHTYEALLPRAPMKKENP